MKKIYMRIACCLMCILLLSGCGSSEDKAGKEALEIAHSYQNGEIDAQSAMANLIALSHQTDNEEIGKAIESVGLNIGAESFQGTSKTKKSIENLEILMGERTEATENIGANGVDVSAVEILSSGEVNQTFENDEWKVEILSYDMGYPETYKKNVGECYLCMKAHVTNKSHDKAKLDYTLHTYLDGKECNLCFMDFYGGGLTMSSYYGSELLGGAEADIYLCYSFNDSSIPKQVIMQNNDTTVIEFSLE